ncbi:MAG TPA: dCTP deaminase [Bryobacteraceae bacterium]|nr:dCTP deaminase [Bryobacteraceae bacterium]
MISRFYRNPGIGKKPYDQEMVLSDVDIRRYLTEGKIKITPALPPDQYGSCSVDFRLGEEFSVFEHSRHALIDLREKTAIQDLMRTITVAKGDAFILQPGEFALAITEETLELDDDVLGRLEGRSSLGRIGIIVHGTAGLFDPGWRGRATLELSNLGVMPVALYPGMRICSFTFEQLSSRVEVPYHKKIGNKYAGQDRPVASRLATETSR